MIPSYVPEAQQRVTHYVRYLEPVERGLPDLQDELPCSSPAQARLVASKKRADGKRAVCVLTKAERDALS